MHLFMIMNRLGGRGKNAMRADQSVSLACAGTAAGHRVAFRREETKFILISVEPR